MLTTSTVFWSSHFVPLLTPNAFLFSFFFMFLCQGKAWLKTVVTDTLRFRQVFVCGITWCASFFFFFYFSRWNIIWLNHWSYSVSPALSTKFICGYVVFWSTFFHLAHPQHQATFSNKDFLFTGINLLWSWSRFFFAMCTRGVSPKICFVYSSALPTSPVRFFIFTIDIVIVRIRFFCTILSNNPNRIMCCNRFRSYSNLVLCGKTKQIVLLAEIIDIFLAAAAVFSHFLHISAVWTLPASFLCLLLIFQYARLNFWVKLLFSLLYLLSNETDPLLTIFASHRIGRSLVNLANWAIPNSNRTVGLRLVQSRLRLYRLNAWI